MTKHHHNLIFNSDRWDGFEFRDDDIVISTPAKCGTTWTQMITALLVFDTTDLPAPLAHLSPWLDMQTRPLEDVQKELADQTHRRFIKAHLPLDALPWDERVTYITVGRDPRDVAVSMRAHIANIDFDVFMQQRIATAGLDDLAGMPPPEMPPDDPREAFWHWINDDNDDPMSGLKGMVQHLGTFWERRNEPSVVLLHYGDLQADLVGQMAYLAKRLGIERSRERLEELAPAASFDEMRSAADRVAPNSDQGFWKSTTGFFRSGTTGQWHDLMGDDDATYEARLAQFASPELAHWLHHGTLS